MLIVRPVGSDVGGYYLRGPDTGRWEGRGAATLGLDGPPTPVALRRVLAGRQPATGMPLGQNRQHRRAGWDLIFAAPKSVSVLAAVASDRDAEAVRAAHRRAVGATMRWMGEEACWARRAGQRVAAGGTVTARFDHTLSAAGDPHLHSHVVLANLVQGPDGRWSALDGSALWQAGRTMGPLYDLALRHELCLAGLQLRWALESDRTADIADVPRPAIEATSTRRRELRRALEVEGSGTEEPAARRREAARVTSRGRQPDRTWRQRLDDVGFAGPQVEAILEAARHRSHAAPEPTAALPVGEARAWLSEHRSTWTRSDAVAALAATLPAGAAPTAAWRGVGDLCAGSEPVAPDRWTTPEARRVDQAVETLARADGPTRAAVGPRVLAGVLARRPGLTEAQRQQVRDLVGGPHPVAVLRGVPGRAALLDQAAVVDAARAAWQETGHLVTLDASASARRRWEAVAGIAPRFDEPSDRHGPALLAGSDPPNLPSAVWDAGVRIVDRADRRSSRDLAELMEMAAVSRTKVVLVEGGTLPALRQPGSAALAAIGPEPALTRHGPDAERAPTVSTGRLPATVTSPRLVVSSSFADAFDTLIDRWMATPEATRRPLIVGLGPAEIEGLNRAARSRLVAAGVVGPDVVEISGRAFGVGDVVVARRPGSAPAGSLGTVDAVGRRPAGLTVRWWDKGPEDRSFVTAWDVRRLAHGYAVGPGLADRIGGPALVLGDPGRIGPMRGRDATGFVVAPASGRSAPLPDRLTRMAEQAVAERAVAERAVAEPAVSDRAGARRGAMPPTGTGRWVSTDPALSTLSELAAAHDRAGRDLRASLPPDVSGDRRRLDEDLAWRATTGPAGPHPGFGAGLDEQLAGRAEEVRRGERHLQDWSREHAGQLRHWLDLRDAMDRRADLVTHALAADPTAPGHRLVGPEPEDRQHHALWERAARAVAVHGDRWPEGRPGLDVDGAERLSLLRRDQALDHLARSRGRVVAPGRDDDLGLGR